MRSRKSVLRDPPLVISSLPAQAGKARNLSSAHQFGCDARIRPTLYRMMSLVWLTSAQGQRPKWIPMKIIEPFLAFFVMLWFLFWLGPWTIVWKGTKTPMERAVRMASRFWVLLFCYFGI